MSEKSKGRKILEEIHLPTLSGSVLFVGVAQYTVGYEKLIREPRKFETIDIDPKRAKYGSPYRHYTNDFLEFNPTKKYDNVLVCGLDPKYTDKKFDSWEEWAKKLLIKADSILKVGGNLIFSGCMTENYPDVLSVVSHYKILHQTIERETRLKVLWIGIK